MRCRFLAAVFVGLVALVQPATATESRVALVIGNSAYQETPLANPANDARLMAETLRGLGFEVNELTDADQKAMKIAILDFGDRLEAAGQDAVGLFYYAGHGVQVGDQNFLIPLGSAIRREKDVAVEAVSAGWVLGQMEFAGNRVNFVILDACRNNPLTRSFRSLTRGLARMNAPRGSLVACSTAPGQVAADGTGANSPYTLALSQAMQTPGIPAEKMFKLVRDSVMTATKDQQVPWEESSLTGEDFFFAPATVAAATPPATTPVEATGSADTAATERLFWESIRNSTDPADFEVFLEQFSAGVFAGLARNRLAALGSQAGSASKWNGTWNTNFGSMTLSITGDKVTGAYEWDQGRIEGQLSRDGRTLTGTWRETPSYSPPADGGALVFTLSEDGQSFSGQWWRGDDMTG